MFPNSSLFRKIACPAKEKCSTMNCMFNHSSEKVMKQPSAASKVDQQQQPEDSTEGDRENPEQLSGTVKTLSKFSSDPIKTDSSDFLNKVFQNNKENGEVKQVHKISLFPSSAPRSDEKTDSEGSFLSRATVIKRPAEDSFEDETSKKQKPSTPTRLLPKSVLNPPTTVQERMRYLKNAHESLKSKLRNKDDQYCVNLAVKLELEAAKSTTSKNVYERALKIAIYKIRSEDSPQGTPSSSESSQPVSKIDDPDWVIPKLSKLMAPKNKLKRNSFILQIPPPYDGHLSKKVMQCSHCGDDFILGEQMLHDDKCVYHPERPKLTKQVALTNSRYNNSYNTRTYPCCNTTIDDATAGCATLKHHVYKLEDPIEMHHKIPFIFTADRNVDYLAVGLDCEMGWTSFGFELIRVTVVDFFTEEKILDTIVQPLGKMIDLNTKFSGVSEITDSNSVSFKKMRDLLFNVINRQTIIIGHGLENDMNVLRLIHTKIIDTSILYSTHYDPKRKDPLRLLVSNFLNRKIQSGEHDSMEDALACIHIIKHKILERYT
ncbi:RNA exonuclease [Komagataella phaffii]|nr:GQ67_02963T0 [Komagataella phaffii]AOA65642.1 GQ68_02284T0 [Komagataella phaffii GS115]